VIDRVAKKRAKPKKKSASNADKAGILINEK